MYPLVAVLSVLLLFMAVLPAKASPFACDWGVESVLMLDESTFAGIGPYYNCFGNLGLLAFGASSYPGGGVIDSLLLFGRQADLPSIDFGLTAFVSGFWHAWRFSQLGLRVFQFAHLHHYYGDQFLHGVATKQ